MGSSEVTSNENKNFLAELFNRRFQRCRLLSSTPLCRVYVVFDVEREREMAFKILRRKAYESERKQRDRQLENLWNLSSFSHPHIVQLADVMFEAEELGMLMELVPHGITLADVITQVSSGKHALIPHSNCKRFFVQLITAVDFCHRIGIVHRDIRPENILLEFSHMEEAPPTFEHLNLSSANLKLAGLGFSKSKNHGPAITRGGAILYTAPELYTSLLMAQDGPEDFTSRYNGEAVDVYSSGVVLYEMQYGGHPYIVAGMGNINDKRALLRQLINNSIAGNMQLPAGAPEKDPDIVALLQGMLNPNPEERFNLGQVVNSLWFQKGLTEPVEHANARLLMNVDFLEPIEDIPLVDAL